eukprot:CAMPEP_0119325478 /NCGR_PEP_ID=MMETSP1333-20130426/65927_1 /TAXON_ID=418940 /ORGANISM="Scyphosphaera apsteinii, Strain RCC1455" /LENGTH=270 /DNA_ID=CAMNT_0007333475 /DNA_START=148 /DNA_END=960 /DNA_ORIENTATION=+
MFVRKVSDSARCPESCVPSHAVTIDGGTSFEPGDAFSWLQIQKNWHVKAFEPLPRNCRLAQKYLASFRNRTDFVCKALGSTAGNASFHVDGEQGGSLIFRPTNSSLLVPVTTLDVEVGFKEVFLLKLDLQGSELLALRGATHLLRDNRLSWLFTEFSPTLLQNGGTSAAHFLRFLKGHGFVCRNFRENTYRPWWCNEAVMQSDGRTMQACWTDLICGHKSVAVTSVDWEQNILSQYCRHQSPFCKNGKDISCFDLHNNPTMTCKGIGYHW